MRMKFLVCIAVISLVTGLGQGQVCTDVDADKVECGNMGTDEASCVIINECCWARSETFGVPWCFHPTPDLPPQCTAVESKTDCGYVGIDREECVRWRGCCWEPSNTGDPWCFFAELPPECAAMEMKEECGYLGITPEECLQRGCCWQYSPWDPWCYLPDEGSSGASAEDEEESPVAMETQKWEAPKLADIMRMIKLYRQQKK